MRISVLVLMLLASGGLPALFAGNAPDVAVRCLGPDEAWGNGGNPPIYAFGGQPLKFAAEVTAPIGSHLGLYANLFQAGDGGLSLLLLKNLPLSQGLAFDGRTQWIAACTVPSLPPVKRATRMLLKLLIRAQGQPPEAPRPAGAVDLFVYPRLAAGEWKKTFAAALEQGGLGRIAVFGREGGLRRFLRRQQIAFEDLGADWPGTLDSQCLYLGDSPPPKPDGIVSLTGFHITLFLPGASGSPALPGVYSVADTAGGSLVKVTLPALLDHLDEDPRNQQTLLEILRQALNPRAIAEDSTSTWP